MTKRIIPKINTKANYAINVKSDSVKERNVYDEVIPAQEVPKSRSGRAIKLTKRRDYDFDRLYERKRIRLKLSNQKGSTHGSEGETSQVRLTESRESPEKLLAEADVEPVHSEELERTLAEQLEEDVAKAGTTSSDEALNKTFLNM
ncbi:hypothetical protein M407DRAFT_23002 [Tulasnella calospora MUT 4182]|uniref:Uncharacterized protein n=1 Tax=Tulasnella calospora MUT 4182 TaxID=1051891 RepID=A0A0C3QM43_9AGAM|nr:hypothetical protein M407DRAFT_23002 [Tulasnella calospora MUT 4182]